MRVIWVCWVNRAWAFSCRFEHVLDTQNFYRSESAFRSAEVWGHGHQAAHLEDVMSHQDCTKCHTKRITLFFEILSFWRSKPHKKAFDHFLLYLYTFFAELGESLDRVQQKVKIVVKNVSSVELSARRYLLRHWPAEDTTENHCWRMYTMLRLSDTGYFNVLSTTLYFHLIVSPFLIHSRTTIHLSP